MNKELVEQWEENKHSLKEYIKIHVMNYEYEDLVKLTFSLAIKGVTKYRKLNLKEMTEINNGDYQGTLLYIIPFDTYQPNEEEYLITYVDYGSCSGCDTLLSITDYNDNKLPNEEQVSDLMMLCLHLVQNAKFTKNIFKEKAL
jgi:hypothetical protein